MAIAMEVAGDAKLKGFHVVGMEQPGILHVMFLQALELNAMVIVPALPSPHETSWWTLYSWKGLWVRWNNLS